MTSPRPERDEEQRSEAHLAGNPWVDRMVGEMRNADPKAAKFPYIEHRGAPHSSPRTGDRYHATVVLRKDETCKGTGMSLHVYLDGTVKPSRKKYNIFQAGAASAEEMGNNAHLLESKGAGDGPDGEANNN
ncbi:hypothetical protein E4U36_003387 [Claviceps purpurea]|nr:hypothetical protein E4U36_003387 [Claviceps purpurea]